MTHQKDLYLVAAFRSADRARQIASDHSGTLFEDTRDLPGLDEKLPFRALARVATDQLPELMEASEVGLYLICQRTIKPRSARTRILGHSEREALPGVIGLFTMVAHPDLGHHQSDAHWRDHHAPLALESHTAMSHYRQFSVIHRFSGPLWDGFALCGFDSLEDLQERFYDSDEAKSAITADVSHFADTRNSPRRLIVRETNFV